MRYSNPQLRAGYNKKAKKQNARDHASPGYRCIRFTKRHLCLRGLHFRIKKLDLRARTFLEDIGGSSAPWEHLATVSSVFVFLGIVGELIVIVSEDGENREEWGHGIVRPPARSPRWRFWFDIFATIVVLLGILGETRASSRLASINSQLRSKTSELRADSDQLLAVVTKEAGTAATSADSASLALAEAQARLAAVTRDADDLERYLGVRVPSRVSSTTRRALAAMQNGRVHFEVADDDESKETAISLSDTFFRTPSPPGRIRKNWGGVGWYGPMPQRVEAMYTSIVGALFNPGISVFCGTRRSAGPPQPDRLQECDNVKDSIVQDLIRSGIAASASPVVNGIAAKAPEGDLVIQVWPKPTLEKTRKIIRIYKIEQKERLGQSQTGRTRPR